MGGLPAHRRTAALALSLAGAALAASGCGGGKSQEQDKDEPAGNFEVRLVRAEFPLQQKLAKDSKMVITVENAGTKRVPNINVTVKCPGGGLGGSFMTAVTDSDLADPQRPQFIVNELPTRRQRISPPLDPAPLERTSALVDTYPLGPLKPGDTVDFVWKVTAVKAGKFTLCYQVNAGLYGKAKAVPSSDSPPLKGKFEGSVSNEAPAARIAEDDQTVIEGEAQPSP